MDSNDVIQESAAKADDIDIETDLESLLQEGYGFSPPKRGEVREGIIVSVSSSEILIDLGAKSEGVVSGRELERMPRAELKSMKVGDEVVVFVVNPEDRNGNLVLSLSRAQMEKDWREAERLFKTQDGFEGDVAGFNKGGLIVRLGKVRGFVPASQLVAGRQSRSSGGDVSPEDRWSGYTGKTLQLKVIEIDRERNRLILSERAAMREWRKAQKEKLLSELTEGEIREGDVISLADFGAFVDLGGADGLIHLSELSWRRVNHPREVLNVGDRVKVYVLNVDRARRRIGLSLKRLQPDPWTLVEENYEIDQLVEGVITKLAKFGAFAHIVGDEEIEGLIHISELSEGHIAHPKEVVQEEQVVTLRVIRIDAEQRRMGLSLKRVDQAEYADLDWEAELAASQAEAAEVGEEAEDDLQAETVAPSSEMSQDAVAPEAEPVKDTDDQVDDAVAPSSEVSQDQILPEEEPAEDAGDQVAETVAPSSEMSQDAVAPEAEPVKDTDDQVDDAVAPSSEVSQDQILPEEEPAEDAGDQVAETVAPSSEVPQDQVLPEAEPVKDADEPVDDVVAPSSEVPQDQVLPEEEPVEDAGEQVDDAVAPSSEVPQDAASPEAEPVKDADEPVAETMAPSSEVPQDAASPEAEPVKDADEPVAETVAPSSEVSQDQVLPEEEPVEDAGEQVDDAVEEAAVEVAAE